MFLNGVQKGCILNITVALCGSYCASVSPTKFSYTACSKMLYVKADMQ